jgi:hypothetical protein
MQLLNIDIFYSRELNLSLPSLGEAVEILQLQKIDIFDIFFYSREFEPKPAFIGGASGNYAAL